jgi:hypothetical protein
MPIPQEEFRSELQSLRATILSSIQQSIPSNVDQGLKLYERLIEAIFTRYEVLNVAQPQYSESPFLAMNTNGQEMSWLRSDYQDFLEQVMFHDSRPVAHSVIDGLSRAASICTQYGDVGAYTLFLDLLTYAWRSPFRSDISEMDRESTDRRLLSSLNVLGLSVIMSTQGRSQTKPRLVAETIKTFSDFMKASIDSESAHRLRLTADQLIATFASHSPAQLFLSEPHDIEELSTIERQLTAAALIGNDGWILYLGQHDGNRETLLRLRASLSGALSKVNPWDALPLVENSTINDLFEWTKWELFSGLQRQGFQISIRSYMESAVLVEAAFSHQTPKPGQFTMATASFDNWRDHEFAISKLIGIIDDLPSKFGWISLIPLEFDAIQAALSEMLVSTQSKRADAVIGRELEVSRELVFRTALERARNEPRLAHLFSSRDIAADQITDDVRAPDKSEYLTVGIHQLIPKDYFTDTGVEANENDLAFRIVQGMTRSEDALLHSQLILGIPPEPIASDQLLKQVKSEVVRLQTSGFTPYVLLFGTGRLARLFEKDGESWQRSSGTNTRLAEIFGVPLYWSITSEIEHCLVLPLGIVGRIGWRRIDPRAGDRQEESGRLIVGIQAVTEQTARELIDSDDAFNDFDSVANPNLDPLQRLQENVIVRVLEDIAWIPGESMGRAFEVNSPD